MQAVPLPKRPSALGMLALKLSANVLDQIFVLPEAKGRASASLGGARHFECNMS